MNKVLAGVAQWVKQVPDCKPKGHQFDSWSRGCFSHTSMTFLLPSPLSKK